MDLELNDKIALVTGASRGIGLAIVKALLAEGMTVAFTARRQDGIDAALETLGTGAKASGHCIDSVDTDAVSAWVDRCAESYGRIDVVVSNTSAGGGVELGLPGWRQALDTDILGTVALVDRALPYLEKTRGCVVQIATITATEDHDFPGNPAYGAVKAALIRYMGRISKMYGAKGIRANTVSPGPIFIEGGVWDYVKEAMTEHYERDLKAHPQGRMGTAEEVADAVAFLASARARWVTGQNLCVDGGFTNKIHF